MKRCIGLALIASLLFGQLAQAAGLPDSGGYGPHRPSNKASLPPGQTVTQKLGELVALQDGRLLPGKADIQPSTVTGATYGKPDKPELFPVPERTNADEIEIAGTAELGSNVIVYRVEDSGGYEEVGETTASDPHEPGIGQFRMNVPLPSEGVYRITAQAEVDGLYSDEAEPLVVTVDRTPPAEPWEARWGHVGFDAVELEWDPPMAEDPENPGSYIEDPTVDHYIVEKDGETVDTTTERYYYEAGLGEMAKHQYGIRAVDELGNRSYPLTVWTATFHRNAVTVAKKPDNVELPEVFWQPTISRDGSTVAYVAQLQEDGDDSAGLYVYDLAADSTEHIAGARIDQYLLQDGVMLDMSLDGRLVAYSEQIEEGQYNVAVYDRITKTTERMPGHFSYPALGISMSDDGRWVAFYSLAGDIVANDHNDNYDVFLYDRNNNSFKRISVTHDGLEPDGPSFESAVSGDGRYVMFTSEAGNMLPDAAVPMSRLFVYDTQTERLEHVAAVGQTGDGERPVREPHPSDDGMYVVFTSASGFDERKLFVLDRHTGFSRPVIEFEDNEDIAFSKPKISGDGRYLVAEYYNYDPYSKPGPDGIFDTFRGVIRYDLDNGTINRVGNRAGETFDPTVSGNGAKVAVTTERDDIYVVCLESEDVCSEQPQPEERIERPGWQPQPSFHGLPVMGGNLHLRAYSNPGEQLEAVINYRTGEGTGETTVAMTESSVHSGLYEAAAPVPQHAVELTDAVIRLKNKPHLSAQLDALPRAVAGRLAVAVQTDFPELLQGASVHLRSGGLKLGAGGKFDTSLTASVGLAAADDYHLKVVDAGGQILAQRGGIVVRSGEETALTVAVRPSAELRVKLQENGIGVSGRTVEFYDTQDMLLYSGKTEADGSIRLWGDHYAGDTFVIRVLTDLPYVQPAEQTVRLLPGTNETVIPITRHTTGQISGTVTTTDGNPAPGAEVTLIRFDGSGLRRVVADEQGTYRLVADAGSYLINAHTFTPYAYAPSEFVRITPGTDISKDLAVQATGEGTLRLDVRMKPLDGDWQPINIASWREAAHYGVRLSSDNGGVSYDIYSMSDNVIRFRLREGGNLRACVSGREAGLTDACADVALDEWQRGTVQLQLEEKGRIRGAIVGEPHVSDFQITLSRRDGQSYRVIQTLYPDGNGRFQASVAESGDYRVGIAFSGRAGGAPLKHTELYVSVADGQIRDLGEVSIPGNPTWFQGKDGNGLNTQQLDAVAGDTVTVRGSYKLTEEDSVARDASLIIEIPAGTELLPDSVIVNGVSTPFTGDQGAAAARIGDIASGREGAFSYRLRILDGIASDIQPSVNLRFLKTGEADFSEELLGSAYIRVGAVSLEAPDFSPDLEVRLSGRAPAGQQVEIYADDREVGRAEATPGGLWYATVSLPAKAPNAVWGEASRYRLMARTAAAAGTFQSPPKVIEVDPERPFVSLVSMRQMNGREISFDPGDGVARFPYVVVPGMPIHFAVTFNAPERVRNVRITVGDETVSAGWNAKTNAYQATFVPGSRIGSGIYVTFEQVPKPYEPRPNPTADEWRDALNGLPDIWRDAVYELSDESEIPEWQQTAGLTDGYYNSRPVKVTMQVEGKPMRVYVRWRIKPTEEPEGGYNRPIPYADYSLTVNEQAGTVTMKATMPASLLNPEELKQLNSMFGPKGIEDHVINAIEFAFPDSKPVGVLATLADLKDYVMDGVDLAKYADDLLAFQDHVINSECHLPTAQRYIERSQELYEQASKDLILKNMLTGIGLVAGALTLPGGPAFAFVYASALTVMGDIIKDRWEPKLEQLKRDFEEEKQWRDDMADAGVFDRCKKQEDDEDTGRKKRFPDEDKVADPTWIWDPSGYVYEALPDNRVAGVTATLLQLDEASGKWHVWDSAWYGQQNPLTTDADGRYGWDVPEGKWKVLFEKEGYLPAESEELTVLPPHLDVNIPMVSLQAPQVAVVDAVYGIGVEVVFTKYMLTESVTDASIVVKTAQGDALAGAVEPIDPAALEDGTTVADRFRFVPAGGEDGFKAGERIEVAVAAHALSYAGISMAGDYTAGDIVVKPSDAAPADGAQSLEAAGGSRMIALEWELNASAKLSDAFKLYWKPQGSEDYTAKLLEGKPSHAVLEGLTPGTGYEVKLVTVGRSGAESAGIGAVAATLPEAELVMDTTAPKPVGRVAIAAESRALNVTWVDPEDEDLRQVLVAWKKDGDERFGKTEYVDPAVQSLRIDGLLPDTRYTVRLIAADTYWNESNAVLTHGRTSAAAPPTPTPPTPTAPPDDDRPSRGGGGGGHAPAAPPSATPSPTPPPTSPSGEEEIDLSAETLRWGGFGGRIRLEAESGAFRDGQTLTVRQLPESQAAVPPAYNRFSDAFAFRLAASGRPAFPVALTMAYDPNKHRDFDARRLGIYRQDEEKPDRWIYVGGVIRTDNNTISAAVDRFGTYAVLDYGQEYADLQGHWAERDLKVLISRHIVDGLDDSTFGPDMPMTRAQFMKLLVQLARLREPMKEPLDPAGEPAPFRDVMPEDWHYPYMVEAKKRKLVQGGGDGNFRPNDPLTREEIAVLVVRMAGLEQQAVALNEEMVMNGTAPQFGDGASVSEWAAAYVELARREGLLNGLDDSRFAPQDASTRAQGSVLILRVMSKLGLIGQ